MQVKGLGVTLLSVVGAVLVGLGLVAVIVQVSAQEADPATENAMRMLEEGQQTFRYDTFGDEVFWGDTLRLHEAIAGEANGGVGPGLTPSMALELGLKVDMNALPAELVEQVQAGEVDLNDPATTLALLQLNSVVGVTGFFDDSGAITSV
ncbi:MAG TPA: hypothetical protein VK003_14400, partial [Oceanobacillus sp.]|nr:hypothetical protein [Oceanobacillus sp.]